MPLKIGYWKIRGLRAPVEILCTYLNAEFEPIYYEAHKNSDGNFDRSEWADVKFQLGLNFPNLPYLIDDEAGLNVTETFAVMKYLGRKFDKAVPDAKDLAGWALAENLEGFLADLRLGFIKIAYRETDDKLLTEKFYQFGRPKPEDWFLPGSIGYQKFERLNQLLKGKDYLLGGKSPSYLDFYLWEITDHHVLFKPDFLQADENLAHLYRWYGAVKNLPAVQKYRSGPYFKTWPVNNKMAWGGGTEPPKTYDFSRKSK